MSPTWQLDSMFCRKYTEEKASDEILSSHLLFKLFRHQSLGLYGSSNF